MVYRNTRIFFSLRKNVNMCALFKVNIHLKFYRIIERRNLLFIVTTKMNKNISTAPIQKSGSLRVWIVDNKLSFVCRVL